jgi:hypothetical protein
MRDWLESVAGAAYATAMLWTFGALVLLLVVLLLIKIVRNLTFGTFVAGGRHRKARLAVMDAAAVDSHRRLVLVRRDDVEHLLLIGGPSDVVVEQNIRLSPAQRRPAEEAPREHAVAEERPQPTIAVAPQAIAPQPPAAPAPHAPQQPAAAHPVPLQRPQPVQPAPRPVAPAPVAHAPAAPARPAFGSAPAAHQSAPHASAPAHHSAPPRPSTIPPAANAPKTDLDDALRHELEVTLDKTAKPDSQLPDSVEDEMSRLLGDLSSTRR